MDTHLTALLAEELEVIRRAGLYKDERLILGPQGAVIQVQQGEVINFCANNYLGLSSHPAISAAAVKGLNDRGYGMSSVRFICGAQDKHRELETRIAAFLGMEDAILYSSCFEANGGLFEALLGSDDVVISDQLNHASIIDGVRLSKASRRVYRHNDMDELARILRETSGARIRFIATDGVFSMDGDFAPLNEICALAEEHNAVVMVDDSHATGFVGPTGGGTPELFVVKDKVDIVTSTLGKALGGASGGFTAARKEVVDFLRQRSRPYLFSNSVPPVIVYASLTALDLVEQSADLRERLAENTRLFRNRSRDVGFLFPESDHPIVPIMIGEAAVASAMAQDLLMEGIYVVGFSFPVVPRGKARIRVQISAAHTDTQLERALEAFERVGRRHGVI